MYNINRKEAANILNISTRSIDRYIRAGKLRSKKQGKIVYINKNDINNILGISKKQEILINKNIENKSISLFKNNNENFLVIFEKLRQEIKHKDEEIKEINIKIGKMEEIIKNSISIIEFKKTQFLLEESKNFLNLELNNIKKELELKNNDLKEERKLNLILIVVSIILFIILTIVWIIKI